MDRDQLVKRLMVTFREELGEHVRALNRDLLALEKTTDDRARIELLHTLFRTAHSLKGAARSVSLDLIETVCHQLEEILAAALDGAALSPSEHLPLLFTTADAVEDAGVRLKEGTDLSNSSLANLLPQLEHIVRELASRPHAGTPEPARAQAIDRSASGTKQAISSYAACDVAAIAPSSSGDEPPRIQPAEVAESTTAPVPTAAPTTRAGDIGSVRVPADKLDAFLARDGELLVARRRVESRSEELNAIRETVRSLIDEWQIVEKPLQRWLPRADRAPGDLSSRHDAFERGPNGRLTQRVANVLCRQASNLRRLEKDLERFAAASSADHRLLKQSTDALDEEIRRVRMIPFGDACEGLERMARDLARTGDKEVVLSIHGGDVELDRSVLEGLKDPLRHLVRNAVDHGIESPDQRRRAGKPEQGHITVTARLRGGRVEVSVADDGRGIDLELLRQTLRRKGLAEPSEEGELVRALFLPGFSTARLVTDLSGRGVGLDVAKNHVEMLHGNIDVAYVAGKSTQFTLSVPLTLTTLRILLVVTGGQTFGFAASNVEKLVRIGSEDLVSVGGRELLALGGAPLPLITLAEVLGCAPRESPRTNGKRLAVIVAAGGKRAAFLVDELLAEQEVVVKNLGSRVRRLRQVSGATLLPSGRMALVLNSLSLIRAAAGSASTASLSRAAAAAPLAKKRILIADDSVTTRTLEKSILEAAGYEVTVAPDGDSAWQLIQEHGTDLLVSDVEMPRMDGFQLTEAIRGSEAFRSLPIILVTARGTEADKARGASAGADAYLVKSSFDQKNLLETIAQLL